MKNYNSMEVCFWALFIFLIITDGNAIAEESKGTQAQGTETQISTNKSWQENPDIYGDRIVWQDSRNGGTYENYSYIGNWDIYMYDLSTHKEIQITLNQSNQYSPSIYMDRVVWVDKRNGNPDIYLQNLTSKKQTRITTSGKAYNPEIYGNRIVWMDGRNGGSLGEYNLPVGNWDVYMYDISTGKETQITDNESQQTNPDIYGDRIVWHDYRNMDWGISSENVQIYMYNLSTSVEIPVYTYGYYIWNGPRIYGDRIVWMEEGPSTNYNIYMYDLSTSSETIIHNYNNSKHFFGYDNNPAIYGNIIVLQYFGNPGNTDIYMYDLSTDTETLIATDESDQLGPSIYGNRIVWTDFRNGEENPDIYMFTISGKEPAPNLPVANFSSNVTTGYAPLSVRFTDLSKNATGRSWDFENDGKVDSTDKTPVHVYAVPGNYTVNLTAKNENGTDSKTLDIVVQSATGKDKVLPVANFNTSVTSGYAPFYIRFTDLSQNTVSRNWDFNNDGIVDSIDANPVYMYTASGIYITTLTVSNENGSSSKNTTITVLTKSGSENGGSIGGSDGSSSSSGGGGGSGGGSPEPQSNVEIKELSQTFITSGNPAKFEFTNNATCVVFVSFDSKKTAGKTTTIVEMLKGKSTLVSELPEGEVFKYLNIWVGNSGFATSKNIENAVVCFRVEKSWIQDKNIDPGLIVLNSYSDKKWEALTVNLLNEDEKFLYFTAKTSGFSFFAITGKARSIQAINGTNIQPGSETGVFKENETGSKRPEIKQETEQKKSPSIPGFDMICVVIGLLAVLLYKRK